MNKNKGFAPIVWVIIVAIVLAISGGSYYFYYNSSKTPKVVTNLDQLKKQLPADDSGKYYCSHTAPFKMHVRYISEANAGMPLILYSESWIKKDGDGNIYDLTKDLMVSKDGKPLAGTFSPNITLSTNNNPSTTIINNEFGGRTVCKIGTPQISVDSPFAIIHGFFMMNFKKPDGVNVQGKTDVVSYDSLPVVNINGYDCRYADSDVYATCFSKEYCMNIYSGLDVVNNTSFKSENGSSPSLTIKTDVDSKTGTINTHAIIGGQGSGGTSGSVSQKITASTNVIEVSYEDFPDSVFDINIDKNLCTDSSKLMDIAQKLAVKTISYEEFDKQEKALKKGPIDVSSLNIDNADFMANAKTALGIK